MNSTPRTDARELAVSIQNEDSCCAIYVKVHGKEYEGGLVDTDFARDLERENAKLLAANAELINVCAEQSAIAGELAELRAEARTADGIKWSEISEMWRHKFEAAERELSDLQTKSAREVFARGVYLGPRGTGSMPKQFAPEWWYNCFNKGYHDMSIFEIEWGYDAYLKYQKTKQ
jgi:hypothetical protein